MTAARAMQSIAFKVLQRFRARVALGERGRRGVQCLVERCQERRERIFESLAVNLPRIRIFPGPGLTRPV